ncbi:MAG: nucleotidyltransferase domain-containing protein [Thermoanaerobaculia bacterium]|nr:nucleotidyltransferase domain-containing protein [Thermoanaerobaculia bacterium]
MVTQDQIDEIVRILTKEIKPEKIILFGSYALGKANEESDLDLAIVMESNLPRFKRGALIRKALRSGGRRWLFPMDILVFTPKEIELFKDSPYSMIHEILLTGKVLYESRQPARLVS